MRTIPDLRFRFDEMFDEASRIDKLLNDPRVTRDTASGKADRNDD
jgi:ribosome-binding factor A